MRIVVLGSTARTPAPAPPPPSPTSPRTPNCPGPRSRSHRHSTPPKHAETGLGRLPRGGMSGDQQECVEDAPPVRFGEAVAHRVRECRQGSHEPGAEVVCIQVECRGDGCDYAPEPGGAPEPDERGGHFGRCGFPGLLAVLARFERDDQPPAARRAAGSKIGSNTLACCARLIENVYDQVGRRTPSLP
jgi:hypothetical protein